MDSIKDMIEDNFRTFFSRKIVFVFFILLPIILVSISGFFLYKNQDSNFFIGVVSENLSQIEKEYTHNTNISNIIFIDFNSLKKCENVLKNNILSACLKFSQNFTKENTNKSMDIFLDPLRMDSSNFVMNILKDYYFKKYSETSSSNIEDLKNITNSGSSSFNEILQISSDKTEITNIIKKIDEINIEKKKLEDLSYSTVNYNYTKLIDKISLAYELQDNLTDDLESLSVNNDSERDEIVSEVKDVKSDLTSIKKEVQYIKGINSNVANIKNKVVTSTKNIKEGIDNIEGEVKKVEQESNLIEGKIKSFLTNKDSVLKENESSNLYEKNLNLNFNNYLNLKSENPIMKRKISSLFLTCLFVLTLFFSSTVSLKNKESLFNSYNSSKILISFKFMISLIVTNLILVISQILIFFVIFGFLFSEGFVIPITLIFSYSIIGIILVSLIGSIIGLISKSEGIQLFLLFYLIFLANFFSSKFFIYKTTSEKVISFMSILNPFDLIETGFKGILLFTKIDFTILLYTFFHLFFLTILTLIIMILKQSEGSSYHSENIFKKLFTKFPKIDNLKIRNFNFLKLLKVFLIIIHPLIYSFIYAIIMYVLEKDFNIIFYSIMGGIYILGLGLFFLFKLIFKKRSKYSYLFI